MSHKSALIGMLALVTAAGAVALPAQKADQDAAKETALVRVAERTFWKHKELYRSGEATTEDLYLWSRRWMDVAQSSSDKREDRTAAIRAHLSRMSPVRQGRAAA